MESCSKEAVLATLVADVKAHTREINELKGIYDIMYSMSTNLAVMTTKVTGIERDVEVVKTDVEAIKQAPVKAYAHYRQLIIGGIITAIIAAFMAGKFI